MLNQIERDVYVLEEGIENPISYVRATNAIPIVFHFRDYEIPDSATAQVFVNKPSGLAVYNSATISGNSVIVDTTMQMFAELGVSELQVQISNGDDSLVTFSCPVKVAQNYIEYPSSQNESSLYNEIRDAISNAGTATTAANQAAQAANDAAEAVKEAVSGVINDSEKSSLTTYSSEKIETEFIKKTGDVSLSTVTFNVAIERANIQSGDTLAVAFGKLSKFCADLQPHAFAAPVNNLTGTDASLPLAAPQGKVLKEEIDELKYFTSIAPTGASNFEANKNMLLVDAGNVNGESNKSGYFSINDSNRSEWRGLSSLMPQSGSFIGFREVYPKQVILDKQHILIKITEMYPVSGRQYFCFYNYGSWGNWTVISPTS